MPMFKFRSLVIWLVLSTPVCTPVLARQPVALVSTLPIVVDTNVAPEEQPKIDVNNGVPVVNIAPRSAGGVSNNRYTEFNVGPAGVVLNNRLGNPPAAVILNQVTAKNRPSELRGKLKVAGPRADIIVANPGGITCDNCKFLNTRHATLTTGKPQVDSNGNIGFHVTSGKINVEGKGLKGANVLQVNLLAQLLKIDAAIQAGHLTIIVGASRMDYATGAVTAADAASAAPQLSLDTGRLGSMHANSIHLICNEAGAGMNIGKVTTTGNFEIDTAGDVHILPDTIVQSDGALLQLAARDLNIEGRVLSDGTASLLASRHATVTGSVEAGLLARLNATQDLKVTKSGEVKADRVLLSAGENVRTEGKLTAIDSLTLTAQRDLNVQADSLLKAGQQLTVQAGGDIDLAGQTRAQDALTLKAGKALRIYGTVATDGPLALKASKYVSVAKNGWLQAGQHLTVQTDGQLNNLGGVLKIAENASFVLAGSLNNTRVGSISVNGSAHIDATSVNNQDSFLSVRGDLTIQVARLNHNDSLSHFDGLVHAGGALNISVVHQDNTFTQSSPLPSGLSDK